MDRMLNQQQITLEQEFERRHMSPWCSTSRGARPWSARFETWRSS
jgi:hypothetical protein